MSYGHYDLRMTQALAESRYAAARKTRVEGRRQPAARGMPSERSGKRGRAGFAQPAAGIAGRD